MINADNISGKYFLYKKAAICKPFLLLIAAFYLLILSQFRKFLHDRRYVNTLWAMFGAGPAADAVLRTLSFRKRIGKGSSPVLAQDLDVVINRQDLWN